MVSTMEWIIIGSAWYYNRAKIPWQNAGKPVPNFPGTKPLPFLLNKESRAKAACSSSRNFRSVSPQALRPVFSGASLHWRKKIAASAPQAAQRRGLPLSQNLRNGIRQRSQLSPAEKITARNLSGHDAKCQFFSKIPCDRLLWYWQCRIVCDNLRNLLICHSLVVVVVKATQPRGNKLLLRRQSYWALTLPWWQGFPW